MTKGQTIIVQFVIFFLTGFFIFISIGTFFKYQSDLFRKIILSSNMNLTNSFLSSVVITLVDSCKECDFVNTTIKTQNTSAGYPIEILIRNSNLETSIPTTTELLVTTIHNLLVGTLNATGASSSAQTIILTFNRTNYTLKVE